MLNIKKLNWRNGFFRYSGLELHPLSAVKMLNMQTMCSSNFGGKIAKSLRSTVCWSRLSTEMFPLEWMGILSFLPLLLGSYLPSNTVSPVRACLSIWCVRFRGTQKEDDCGPLIIHFSQVQSIPILSVSFHQIHSLPNTLPSLSKARPLITQGDFLIL